MTHRRTYLARLGRAAGLLLLATAVVCCSKADPNKTVIVFSYDEGETIKERIIDALIVRFEQENPEIRVRKHPLPEVSDQARVFYLSSMAAQSTFVDVFEAEVAWTSEFAAGGFLLQLDQYVPEEVRSRWIRPAVDQATYAGHLYAIPLRVSYPALFYRTDLLEKYGLSPPTTWEELVEQARQVGEKEGIHGLLWQAEEYSTAVSSFLEFYYNLGGDVTVEDDKVLLDRKAVEETLGFMHDLVHKHEVSPRSVLDLVREDSSRLFAGGKAAFMLNYHQAAVYARAGKTWDHFELAPYPGKGISVTGGYNLAVNIRSGHPEEAVRFARFMANELNQKEFLEHRGDGPVLKHLYDRSSPTISQLSALQRLAENTRTRPKSPYNYRFSLMLSEEVRAVLDEDKSAKEGADSMMRRCAELDFPKTAPPEFPKELLHWQ